MSSFVEAQRGVSKLISIGRYGVLDAIWQDPSRLAAENSRSLERTNPSPRTRKRFTVETPVCTYVDLSVNLISRRIRYLRNRVKYKRTADRFLWGSYEYGRGNFLE
jgi:hypothetical protein